MPQWAGKLAAARWGPVDLSAQPNDIAQFKHGRIIPGNHGNGETAVVHDPEFDRSGCQMEACSLRHLAFCIGGSENFDDHFRRAH